MKEIIVFERDIEYLKELEREREEMFMTFPEYRTEQVPTTFDELKGLVRKEVFEDDRNGVKIGQCIKIEYILIDGKSFMPNGEILDEDNDVFAVNRNPSQMWQIIKGLIGE